MNTFIKLKLNILKNSIKKPWQTKRVSSISRLFLLISLIIFIYLLFYFGFIGLDRITNLGLFIVGKLFNLFIFFIFIINIISSMIICYPALFKSDETKYLVTLPKKLSDICILRFFDIFIQSSWAPITLLIIFIFAYGTFSDWNYIHYIIAAIWLIPLMLISSMIGTILMLTIIKFLKVKYFKIILLVIIIAFAIYKLTGTSSYTRPQFFDAGLAFERFIPYIDLTYIRLSPSFWFVEGIKNVINTNFYNAFLYLSTLLFTSIIFIFIFQFLIETLFKNTIINFREFKPQTITIGTFSGRLSKSLIFIKKKHRILLIKDIYILIRDSSQWMQFIIFGILIGIYFFNLRNFNYDNLNLMWKNIITFLNIFAVGSLMVSLSVRFIFPQISLEGQSYWIIGLTPIKPGDIIIQKFIFFSIIFILIGQILISISNYMLITNKIIAISSHIIILGISISSIAVNIGLGAIHTNFKETNPTKIISNIGGIISFLSLMSYMLVVIGFPGFLMHYYIVYKPGYDNSYFPNYLILTLCGIVVFTACISYIFLFSGIKNFQKKIINQI